MLRPFLFLFFLLNLPALAQAPCDSAEVREWLRTMNRDTVCISKYGICKGDSLSSRMWFYNDSTFDYYYRPADSGRSCYRYYKDYRLQSNDIHRATPGDTDFQWSYYNDNCIPTYYIVEVINDSLSTSDEGGTYYDYYYEVVRGEDGRIKYKQTISHVKRRGKIYRRSVYVNRTKIIHRRKVRVEEVNKEDL